jgi:hypothetical protein
MGEKASSDGPMILTELEDVVHYIDPDSGALPAMEFRFAEGHLLVQVDPGLDEVELSFTWFRPEMLTHWPEARPKSMIDEPPYEGLRGCSSAWRWVLQNQRGFDDGFQIELLAEGATTTIQVLAAASCLQVQLVVPAT